jgi:hypothetical protein
MLERRLVKMKFLTPQRMNYESFCNIHMIPGKKLTNGIFILSIQTPDIIMYRLLYFFDHSNISAGMTFFTMER